MTARSTQLDGLRAVAMLAICWDHWCPHGWPRIFPFEVFLFFFLVMTGYLITGSLLRERDRGEAVGKPWRLRAMRIYQVRRGLRILAPYYAAIALAALLVAPDVIAAPWWYLLHLSNFHFAELGHWPPGTNHFWSLAMQQQFYLVWPFIIWFMPRKALPWIVAAVATTGPASRLAHEWFAQWWAWPQTLTWFNLDFFGIGAVFALARHRGMAFESPLLRWLAWLGLGGYVALMVSHAAGGPTFGLRPLQHALLSFFLCGVIAAATVGIGGPLGRFLNMPFLQRTGALSYGIYLFHNLAPMAAGKLFFFLWLPAFDNLAGILLRLAAFALITWALTVCCWYWIELPLDRLRAKIRRSES